MSACLCEKTGKCKSEIKRIYGDPAADITPGYAPVLSREATPRKSDGWQFDPYLRPSPMEHTLRSPVPDVEDLGQSRSTPGSYNLCQNGSCGCGSNQKKPTAERVPRLSPAAGYSVSNYFDVERKLKAEAANRTAFTPAPVAMNYVATSDFRLPSSDLFGDSMEKLLAIQKKQLQSLGTSISELEVVARLSGSVY
jgi:hypothetical protein